MGPTRKLNNWIHIQEDDNVKQIPQDVLEAAYEYSQNNFLLRYFCKKYQMPPTDSRLLAYTPEEMILEFVADAIEDGRIETGKDGKPIKRVKYKGEWIEQTGCEVIDEFERAWVDQDDEILEELDLEGLKNGTE